MTFAVATVLIAGVNLFALALIVHLMLGWSITTAIIAAAVIVMAYITLGGLTSAIYNEVLQFFIIIAALLPLTLVALHDTGGWGGLEDKVKGSGLKEGGLHAWQGLGVGSVTNPIDANWIAIVFGLGFVLSFGYWTTNFAEVQRALSAKNLSAGRRTPLIGAYPKIFIPALTISRGSLRSSRSKAWAAATRTCNTTTPDRHRVHRQGLRQHHELRPALVQLLQRAALRHVHHRDVLEALDAVGRLLGPDRRHSGRLRDARALPAPPTRRSSRPRGSPTASTSAASSAVSSSSRA
jgi:hypothetical protein